MKLVGITQADFDAEAADAGVASRDLIDALKWEVGDDGHGVLTATWSDGKPSLSLTAKRPDGNLRGEFRACLQMLDSRRRKL
jgi:hypothetical protein